MEVNQPKSKGSSFLGLIFVLLVLVLGISLISLFYFNRFETRDDTQEIKFWLYQTLEPIFGHENTFFIFIRNQEAHDIENIEVILNFPEDFNLNSSFPACDQILTHGCLWSFDKIKKGELKEIEFKGQLFGQVDQVQNFDGNLNFRLAGFSSEFQKRLSYSVMLLPSIFLTWQVPEQAYFGQKIESYLSLENIGQEIIPQTQVIVSWPEDFVFEKSEPVISELKGPEQVEVEQSQRRFKWQIKDLNVGDKKGLNFKGFLKNPRTKELVFNLQAGSVSQDNFFPQIEEQKKIFFEQFNFNVALEVNNLMEQSQSCKWGQALPISLTFQNQSNQIIEDFSAKLKLIGSQYIDFNRLYQSYWHYYQDPDFSVFSASSALVSGRIFSSLIPDPSVFFNGEQEKGWDQSLISVLKQISPKNEGIIIFDLPIKTALEAIKANDFQAQIIVQIFTQGKLANETSIWEIQSNKIKLSVKTDLKLEASARYYDDENAPIGQGPLPPQVGEETRYWVFWGIKNTTNSIKDVLVKTRLPQGIEWTGQTKTSHGLILYNETNQEVSWQIPELSSYQGGPYSLVEAGFEVGLIPKISQTGQTLPLIGDTVLQAKDQFTGDFLSTKISYLDANLKGDFLGQNQGKVINTKD